jgi:hypothetical protein
MRLGYFAGTPCLVDDQGLPHTARDLTEAVLALREQMSFLEGRTGPVADIVTRTYQAEIDWRRDVIARLGRMERTAA